MLMADEYTCMVCNYAYYCTQVSFLVQLGVCKTEQLLRIKLADANWCHFGGLSVSRFIVS